jgi:hypothetical protein
MSEPQEPTFEFADFAVTSTEFQDQAYGSGNFSGPIIVNPSSDNGRSIWEEPGDAGV